MIPEWFHKVPWTEIKTICEPMNLDPFLVAAIIMVESAGNPCAVRYEKSWRYHWDVRTFAQIAGTSQDTEHFGQSASWGLMQVMGTVAREHGFRGMFTQLCVEPELGIRYGCLHLKKFIEKYDTIEDAVVSYNCGSPRRTEGGFYEQQGYVDKVMAFYREMTR